MKFGTLKSEEKDLQSEDFTPYLRNLKNGDTTVRFLDNPEDWVAYREHFIENRSFPCTRDDSCKGCENDDKAKRKYATNVYLVDHNIVLPFKLPVTLAKKMFLRADRNDGVVTDRDYILIRQGQGLDTEYEVDPDDRSKRDIKALSANKHDIESILVSSYEETWGKLDAAPQEEVVEENETSDTIPPWEQEELDEDAVRKMTRSQLVKLAKKHSIKFDADGGKDEILDSILSAAG